MTSVDAFSLEIFHHLFSSVAEEMGVTLGRTGYSPNIKERKDYSCAVFLGDGRMLAQAAHIPVHLGAMPASVKAAIAHGTPFSPGDIIILNDPYLGGTHLPDITLVSPVFASDQSKTPDFFVASRAHHADVGGMSPGSMPLSTELYQEGLIIPPVRLARNNIVNQDLLDLIVRNSRSPDERLGDLAAQRAAHEIGSRRLLELIERYGLQELELQANGLIDYAGRMSRSLIASLPDGRYEFSDVLDDDGITQEPVSIAVTIVIQGDRLRVDFGGSAGAVRGSVNSVAAIVHSAVGYVLRCLGGEMLPANHGMWEPVDVVIPVKSVLDPGPPHAVAGGNVETSMRIVDVLYGALFKAIPDRIPAASQGTMNNLTFGGIHPKTDRPYAYYETMGGGSGADPEGDGTTGIHCHMSNTLNTPIEALEMAMPVRVRRYAIRKRSGGSGFHRGGDGLIREIEFLSPAHFTILSDRRVRGPYGLNGGEDGLPGRNLLICGNKESELSGKTSLDVQPGDILHIETPGGGGWGLSRAHLSAK